MCSIAHRGFCTYTVRIKKRVPNFGSFWLKSQNYCDFEIDFMMKSNLFSVQWYPIHNISATDERAPGF